ncbi:hypothetical protein C8J57DRAFT_48816 [Mycena rebaudengoi]|nr:hypothetical protein C8J57DRAFT_48816 [Mycena rebaudengoi]
MSDHLRLPLFRASMAAGSFRAFHLTALLNNTLLLKPLVKFIEPWAASRTCEPLSFSLSTLPLIALYFPYLIIPHIQSLSILYTLLFTHLAHAHGLSLHTSQTPSSTLVMLFPDHGPPTALGLGGYPPTAGNIASRVIVFYLCSWVLFDLPCTVPLSIGLQFCVPPSSQPNLDPNQTTSATIADRRSHAIDLSASCCAILNWPLFCL